MDAGGGLAGDVLLEQIRMRPRGEGQVVGEQLQGYDAGDGRQRRWRVGQRKDARAGVGQFSVGPVADRPYRRAQRDGGAG